LGIGEEDKMSFTSSNVPSYLLMIGALAVVGVVVVWSSIVTDNSKKKRRTTINLFENRDKTDKGK
jgi:hypothetical protein